MVNGVLFAEEHGAMLIHLSSAAASDTRLKVKKSGPYFQL